MSDSRPWRDRNLERIAEARRILAQTRNPKRNTGEPMTDTPETEPVNPDLDPDIDEEPELDPAEEPDAS